MKMEVNRKIVAMMLWSLMLTYVGYSQKPKLPVSSAKNNNSVSCESRGMPKAWQKMDFETLSICIPEDLKRIDAKCKDSQCLVFENPTYRLNIDFSFDAYRPRYEKKLKSYSEKLFWIDEILQIRGWMWSFEEDRKEYSEFKYHSGVLIIFNTQKDRLIGMTAVSEKMDIKEIMGKIFCSVRFDASLPGKRTA